MKPMIHRKTAPKVKDGQVQYKNNWSATARYDNHTLPYPVVERERPGKNFHHLLKKQDIYKFLEIIPNWQGISVGLQAILLAPGRDDCLGWHRPGIVAICAWPRELSQKWDKAFVEEHRAILDPLGVETTYSKDYVLCHFTENSAKGFQLMHIFLHELSHHFDRVTTKRKKHASRGEDFAENISYIIADSMWKKYFAIFDW